MVYFLNKTDLLASFIFFPKEVDKGESKLIKACERIFIRQAKYIARVEGSHTLQLATAYKNMNILYEITSFTIASFGYNYHNPVCFSFLI